MLSLGAVKFAHKATEFSSIAAEKATEVGQTIQEKVFSVDIQLIANCRNLSCLTSFLFLAFFYESKYVHIFLAII